MKRTLLTLTATFALALAAAAGDAWLTDLPTAQAQAKKDGKLVLLDFTGSDWCGWCIKMKKDSLDQADFLEYAAKNLVLVEVDFPQKKTLAAAQKKANEALKDKYGVDGYPTFVLVDANGKELARQVGYLEGGPKAFIAKIEAAKAKEKV